MSAFGARYVGCAPPADYGGLFAYHINLATDLDNDKLEAAYSNFPPFTPTAMAYFMFEVTASFGWCDSDNNFYELDTRPLKSIMPSLPLIYCGIYRNATNPPAPGSHPVLIDMSPVATSLYQLQIPLSVGQSMLSMMFDAAARQLDMCAKVDPLFLEPTSLNYTFPIAVNIRIVALYQEHDEYLTGMKRSRDNLLARRLAYYINNVERLQDMYGASAIHKSILLSYINHGNANKIDYDSVDALAVAGRLVEKYTRDCNICHLPHKEEQEITYLGCNHAFHADCIFPWLQTNKLCPMCTSTSTSTST